MDGDEPSPDPESSIVDAPSMGELGDDGKDAAPKRANTQRAARYLSRRERITWTEHRAARGEGGTSRGVQRVQRVYKEVRDNKGASWISSTHCEVLASWPWQRAEAMRVARRRPVRRDGAQRTAHRRPRAVG